MGHVLAKSIVVEGEINADIQAENLHLKSMALLMAMLCTVISLLIQVDC